MYEKIFQTIKNKNFVTETKKVLPWFIAALFLFLLHSQHKINSDEGIILNAAWNIINGKKLYLQSFEFISPLAPYLLAWWWKITEISFLSAAILSWLISFSVTIALYLIGKIFNLKNWLFLSVALFILSSAFWPLINHNAYNTAAIIWSVYFILKALEKNKSAKYYFLLGGFLSGLSVLFLQHRGLIFLAISFIFLIYLKIKKQIKFKDLGYFFSAAILPILSLFIFWSPGLLYKNLWLFPLQNYPATNRLPIYSWLICLVMVLIISACVVIKIQKQQKSSLIFLQILSLGFLVSSLPRNDLSHIFQALTIFTIIISLSFEFYLNQTKDKQIISFLLALIFLLFIPQPLFETATARNIVNSLNYYCPGQKTLYSGPFMPGIYFEKRTLNTIPYSFMIPGQQTDAQFKEVVDYFKYHRPDCVILNYRLVDKFNYNKNNPLDNFIKNNYQQVANVGDGNIFIKK